MTTKSRLGKGLGALFPTLPGKSLSNDGNNDNDGGMNQESGSVKSPVATQQHHARKKAVGDKDARGISEATHGTSTTDVSRETPKGRRKRVSVPGFETIAHPSDFFFGGDKLNQTERIPENVRESDSHRESVMPNGDMNSPATTSVSGATVSHGDHTTGVSADAKEPELKPVEGGYLAELSVEEIGPNLHQPRVIFDEDELRELAASISEVGVLQPIVVRQRPTRHNVEQFLIGESEQSETKRHASAGEPLAVTAYELIMGERRWRAAQLAGMTTIPAIVRTTADDDMLRDALLENLHRVALNPLEEAAAYQQMIDEFGLTQAQLSKSISKSRPQIANTLRLMNLPPAVQKKVAAGVLSAGHARALLSLPNEAEMNVLADRIIAEGLSVRSTEEIVSMKVLDGDRSTRQRVKRDNPWLDSPLQRDLEDRFDTKVSIKGTRQHGRIEIVFSSPEDMDRIMGILVPGQGGSPQSQWI